MCIDHNTVGHETYTSWGSPAFYMTKYFQEAFGASPTIIAKYGADFVEYTNGISLYPSEPGPEPTLVYENIIKDGKRTQYCRNHKTATPAPITPFIKALAEAADMLFLAPLTPAYQRPYIAELMAHTSDKCLKVLLPQGYLRHIREDGLVQPRCFEEAHGIMPFFDLVILSDEDYPHAESQARIWKKANPLTEIIVTQNALGASIIQKDKTIHIPTTPIPNEQILNSVGCGDVFSASTAYHLFVTNDLALAVQRGHRAASQKLLATAP